jgi:hypothetical protein
MANPLLLFVFVFNTFPTDDYVSYQKLRPLDNKVKKASGNKVITKPKREFKE